MRSFPPELSYEHAALAGKRAPKDLLIGSETSERPAGYIPISASLVLPDRPPLTSAKLSAILHLGLGPQCDMFSHWRFDSSRDSLPGFRNFIESLGLQPRFAYQPHLYKLREHDVAKQREEKEWPI